MKRKWLLVLVIVSIAMSAMAGCSSGSDKSDWAKNVELYVPAKAGGGTDVVARAYSTQVSKDSGKTITIVNNADGGGVVSLETVRNAPKDGSKLCFYHTSMLITSATGLYDKNLLDDFTVIKSYESDAEGTYALVVRSDGPYKKLEDLMNAAKATPDKVIIGVQTGGMTHLMGGTLNRDAGVQFKLAEAGSDTEKLTALVGGSIDAAMVNTNQAKQYVEAGKATVLAVVSKGENGGRSPVFPDVLSFAEQGYKSMFFNSIMFVIGPKDMDPAVVKEIGDYFASAAGNEEVVGILKKANMNFMAMDDAVAKDVLGKMASSINTTVNELGLKKK